MNQTKMVLKANSFLLVIGMTNPEQDTRQAVKECTVTQVHGQPTNQDIDLLEEKAIKNPYFKQVLNESKELVYG